MDSKEMKRIIFWIEMLKKASIGCGQTEVECISIRSWHEYKALQLYSDYRLKKAIRELYTLCNAYEKTFDIRRFKHKLVIDGVLTELEEASTIWELDKNGRPINILSVSTNG